MDYPENQPQSGKPGGILLLIGAFALVDLITPAVLRESQSPELPVLFAGAFVAQPGLLAVWAVMGPQRLLVRWLLSLLVAVLLWFVFLFGMTMTTMHPRDVGEMAKGMFMLPLAFLAVQLPLWVLKMATGWSIIVGGKEDSSPPSASRQFRLQHILGATTAVAAAMGLASAGLPYLGGPNGSADPLIWLRLMGICLICGAYSALSTLPCLWAAFVARNKTASTIIIAVYAVVMSLLAVAVVSAIVRSAPPDRVVTGFILFHGSLAFVLLGSLHIARACGYVLLRPGRMQAPATPTGSSPFAGPSDPFEPPSA